MSRKASRRTFLKLSAAAASLSAAELAHAVPPVKRIAIVTDDDSPLVNNDAVRWATQKLRDAITPRSLADKPSSAGFSILIAPVDSPLAKNFPNRRPLTEPETAALFPGRHNDLNLLATGSDVRGITYAILELAERINSSDLPMLELQLAAPLIETSPNKVRSVARGFCSEIEDKPWFYDRAFWTAYLDTLATARFNRFALTFGLAYDFPRGVTGDYLHFPYPYLVEVPGYEGVHVEPALQPGERQRNLDTLQFIAAETARRGMDFQLGIWTHAYQWTDSPHSDHHIVGLTPETHAQYCHDALALILKACPQIKGITMRIHGESGIPEGSYPFWQKVFDAIPEAGRKIEIDMHAKGLNQTMIDMAIKTGMPVKAGAKFWAEHLGLGYQQTDIRANEYPREGVTGTFAVSSGARNFTRYGYGDFYQQNSGIELLYRVWPGTQRHLLWCDPALASGYGRAANFCGAAGLELMEPLFFKGREGSGLPGGRDAYADASFGPASLDTAKFTTTFMLWGRYLYNPDTDPSFYHRYLKQQFGPAGPALQTALAASSRILPLVTTAWCPSASNHEYWPEMITPRLHPPLHHASTLHRQSRSAQRQRHQPARPPTLHQHRATRRKSNQRQARRPLQHQRSHRVARSPGRHLHQRPRNRPHRRRHQSPHTRIPSRRRRHPHPQRPRHLLRQPLPRRIVLQHLRTEQLRPRMPKRFEASAKCVGSFLLPRKNNLWRRYQLWLHCISPWPLGRPPRRHRCRY